MGLASMLSTLLSKSSSSTNVGFALFIIFSISETIVGHVGYSAILKKYRILYVIFVIFPHHPFGGSIKMLIDASSNKGSGIGLNKLRECPDSSPGCVPLHLSGRGFRDSSVRGPDPDPDLNNNSKVPT